MLIYSCIQIKFKCSTKGNFDKILKQTALNVGGNLGGSDPQVLQFGGRRVLPVVRVQIPELVPELVLSLQLDLPVLRHVALQVVA